MVCIVSLNFRALLFTIEGALLVWHKRHFASPSTGCLFTDRCFVQKKMSHSRSDCRIYVGNLPPDIRTKDIQDLFYKFGKVTFVDLKNRRGPPFAFVEFEDPR